VSTDPDAGARPAKPRIRDLARKAWRRLRGGELTPWRAALSVGLGLAIGVTPLWGLHWAIVLAVCVPLRLDTGIAYLAANVSLPFIAPFITFAEIQVGARLLGGAWLSISTEELAPARLAELALELAVGTVVVALSAGTFFGALTYAVVFAVRRRRQRAAT
jgi:uncharacterized protein (TIGR03546 family)